MCVQDSDLPADQDLLKTSPNPYHNNNNTNNNISNNNSNTNNNNNNNNNISNSSNNNSNNISNNSEAWSDLQSQIDSLSTQMQNSSSPNSNTLPLESISEDIAVAVDEERNGAPVTTLEFLPNIRSGDWSDIGGRDYMEDTHVCISDLARSFGSHVVTHEAVSFYGVFDGHGGKAAAQFVRDHLPRVIVEDADFPLNLETVVARSFVKTDDAFAESCSVGASQTSGTTALTAMIFGRSLLVANAGDCRAVLSRRGAALALSKDHRPCSRAERARVESMGGFVEYGYLNGQLGVTRALGDWHLEGMKHHHDHGPGPLSAEPELELVTLTREDEFLIIASDGVWDVFSNQNAVDFARRRLQIHNDVKMCCKEIVEEAVNRGATDNLTVVMVCFHAGPPPAIVVPQRMRVRRSISAEGLQSIKLHL